MRPWFLSSLLLIAWSALSTHVNPATAAESTGHDNSADGKKPEESKPLEHFKTEQSISHGTVTVDGQRIDYDAYAGTLVVHPKGWDDVPQNAPVDADKNPPAEASMFYVAYFKSRSGDQTASSSHKGEFDKPNQHGAADRPVTFIYNGGPGSSSVWLHMGAWGPRRVITADATHTPAAPYSVVNNAYSLLDVSDLVFIDAPGTGFSRIAGKDRENAFYGVDQDAQAFANFIVQFLTQYGRWNSPKYLFGESYGTARSAALIARLETEKRLDFNGVILLSQVLNFDDDIDEPELNPGIDLPYELALPSMCAAAWYHHRLPHQPAELQTLLQEVEVFAMGDYARALAMGSALSTEQRAATAAQLHDFTGLPTDYILRANLRVSGPEFEQMLQLDTETTTGRLDARFSGPNLDPLAKEASYDPMLAAFQSAYVSVFNDYVRKDLRFSADREFRALSGIEHWDLKHTIPAGDSAGAQQQRANVMPDLAIAMKYNPRLHVMLNGGYFDIGTPFYAGIYEMQHLDIPPALQKNIEFAFYETGHMVYVQEDSLKEMHSKVAAFIRSTSAR